MSAGKSKFNQPTPCEACGRGVSYSSLELFEWARRVERARLEKELKILRATVQFLSAQESLAPRVSKGRGSRNALTVAVAASPASVSV